MNVFFRLVPLLALLLVAASAPAQAEYPERIGTSGVASTWNHNGSTMGLIVDGDRRMIIYLKPRSGMANLVAPGTVLFCGVSRNNRYDGVARRFSAGIPPLEYRVSGPIERNGSRVVLSGVATIRTQDGGEKTIDDTLVFDLISAR